MRTRRDIENDLGYWLDKRRNYQDSADACLKNIDLYHLELKSIPPFDVGNRVRRATDGCDGTVVVHPSKPLCVCVMFDDGRWVEYSRDNARAVLILVGDRT